MSLLDGVCGTGGWSGPLPGDPDNNVLLTATAVYGGVEVAWTYPAINPHAVAHVRLYRGVSINFANATLHKIVTGNSYYDKIDPSVETAFYYWIEIVSVYGTVGAPIGPASVTAIPTIHQTMQMLTGQINSGTLATALKAEIDVIDQVALDLALETQTRTASETALANAITAVQTENGELSAYILNETTVRAAADSAITSQVNTAVSALNGDLAAAQTTLQTNIDTVDGKVTNIGALYTVKLTVNGLAGGFGVYNDGTEVQAGFDVDTFWVGKDSTDKVKPFIISGGIVYIDSARIADASINSAKIANLDAAKINAGTITTDKLVVGSVTANATSSHGWTTMTGNNGSSPHNNYSITMDGPLITLTGGMVDFSFTGYAQYTQNNLATKDFIVSQYTYLILVNQSTGAIHYGPGYMHQTFPFRTSSITGQMLVKSGGFFASLPAGQYRLKIYSQIASLYTDTSSAALLTSGTIQGLFYIKEFKV